MIIIRMSDSDSSIETKPRKPTSLRPQNENEQEAEDEIDVAGLVTKLLSDRKNANVLCDLLRNRSKCWQNCCHYQIIDLSKGLSKQMISTKKSYSLPSAPSKSGSFSRSTMDSWRARKLSQRKSMENGLPSKSKPSLEFYAKKHRLKTTQERVKHDHFWIYY